MTDEPITWEGRTPLTERERDLMDRIVAGMSVKEAADDLGRSRHYLSNLARDVCFRYRVVTLPEAARVHAALRHLRVGPPAANLWPRLEVSLRMRFAVLERDGFACRYCGRRPPEAVLQVDHVIPVAGGGSDDMSNLVAACRDCNLGKSGRPLNSGEAR